MEKIAAGIYIAIEDPNAPPLIQSSEVLTFLGAPNTERNQHRLSAWLRKFSYTVGWDYNRLEEMERGEGILWKTF